MVRDHKFRGHSPEKTISMWGRVCDGEDRYIKVFKPEADLLVDTSFSYELCVLAGMIEPLAGSLPEKDPYAEKMNELAGHFALFDPIPLELVPKNSMLREFLGE